MEDFRASAPEQRGPANPNVESIPFEEMKERILKIVNGYNGLVTLLINCRDAPIPSSRTCTLTRKLIPSWLKWMKTAYVSVYYIHEFGFKGRVA